MFKRLFMPIKGNRNIKEDASNSTSTSFLFDKQQALFIAQKLQQANYKGEEFEVYQQIMLRLKSVIDKG
tara:strand:- start:1764 stop:1970 length:207 start_codon:yes stop_codon:yes gene_type:complete